MPLSPQTWEEVHPCPGTPPVPLSIWSGSQFFILTILLKASDRANDFSLMSPLIYSVQMTHPTVPSIPSAQESMPSRSGISCTTWTSWHRCLWRRKSTWATLLRSFWLPASSMGCPVMPGQERKAALLASRTSGFEHWAPSMHLQLSCRSCEGMVLFPGALPFGKQFTEELSSRVSEGGRDHVESKYH